MTLLHLVRLLKRSAQDKASIGQEAIADAAIAAAKEHGA